MKTKTIKAFTLKAILILTYTLVGFSDFSKCHAQSIVGKWNQITAKQFLTAEGAKTHGKSVLETQMAAVGTVVFEFKSNHTYVEKTSHPNDSGVLTFTGTWSVSGNQLELKLDPEQEDPKYNPKKDAISPVITMSVNGNTMIWTTLYPDGKITSKIELTLTRM
jgi:Lipocalin-like domain